uniref:NADH dehydrogenase subunit 4L n=1 Tax=Euphaedusa planostriata TaxID=2798995 RepID=A0A7T7D6L1_9EUPU|nr:NADH dehydrogenase subunit 4L [Euphaedusa planostriata]QQL04601.1 NADH dehydrogenase subunit 4L [Euphaedusa planostriata]
MFYLTILALLLGFMLYLYNQTKSHYLIVLLYLEVMMLISLMLVNIVSLMVNGSVMAFLLVMTLAVGEAAFGLGMLLSLIKLNGNDFIKSSHLI